MFGKLGSKYEKFADKYHKLTPAGFTNVGDAANVILGDKAASKLGGEFCSIAYNENEGREFDPAHEAGVCRKAMEGMGTDEKALTNSVVFAIEKGKTQELRQAYEQVIKRDLLEDIKKETSGSFREALVGALMLPWEATARHLRKAMEGLGTNENAITQLLPYVYGPEMEAVKEAFMKETGKGLDSWIRGDFSGQTKYLLLAIVNDQGPRTPFGDFDAEKEAAKHAGAKLQEWHQDPARWHQRLPEKSEIKDLVALDLMGKVPGLEDQLDKDVKTLNLVACKQKDHSAFVRIVTAHDRWYLAWLDWDYQRQCGSSLQEDLDDSLGDSAEEYYKALLWKHDKYYAHLFREAMDRDGTNDSQLVRITVCRQHRLQGIAKEFWKMRRQALWHRVQKETSGTYGAVVTQLVIKNSGKLPIAEHDSGYKCLADSCFCHKRDMKKGVLLRPESYSVHEGVPTEDAPDDGSSSSEGAAKAKSFSAKAGAAALGSISGAFIK